MFQRNSADIFHLLKHICQVIKYNWKVRVLSIFNSFINLDEPLLKDSALPIEDVFIHLF